MTTHTTELVPHQMDIAERRAMVQTLSERLNKGDQSDDILHQARELAEDCDWQVRHDVALLITYLPEEALQWFAERLTSDSNAYVQRAARRTFKQRQRRDREIAQRRRKHTRITRQMQKLQSGKEHPMAKQVGRLCREHSEELVGQLVHDMRCVSGRLTSACLDLVEHADDAQADSATTVREQVAMLERLTDDWQRFSEPLHLEVRSEKLRRIIDTAIQAALRSIGRRRIDASRVTIEVDINGGIVVPIARYLIEIAITNVIQNAYESFLVEDSDRPAGEIRVRAVATGDIVEINVTDNGPGMTADELAVISAFLPGCRNYAKPFSTGFGLAIASRNIAAHSGTVAITSCEGIGTQVTIVLPLDCKQ